MSVSVDQFLRTLRGSGLLDEEEIERFLDALPAGASLESGEDLARLLHHQGKLTRFQAQCIYRGKTKGLVLGNYVILDRIGSGGMGHVYKAEHRRMKRLVALKAMRSQVTRSRTFAERFRREVEAAAKLDHPNIVTAYDADEAEGIHFLVMEYVEGKDLASVVVEQGPFSPGEAVGCVIQAARGLQCAHRLNIIHRDVKPSNLLLDRHGTVKILDMGLARFEASAGDQGDLTFTGQFMGTPDYVSPEQAEDTHGADQRADIYSLGCTLFFLLTGRPPYEADTIARKLFAHREEPVPSLRAIRDDVPEGLDRVFAKMVAKDVAERLQTMTDVIGQLEPFGGTAASGQSAAAIRPARYAGGEETRAGRDATPVDGRTQGEPSADSVLPTVPPVIRVDAGHGYHDRPARRPRWLARAAAAAVVAALAGAAAHVYWTRWNGGPPGEIAVDQSRQGEDASPAEGSQTDPVALLDNPLPAAEGALDEVFGGAGEEAEAAEPGAGEGGADGIAASAGASAPSTAAEPPQTPDRQATSATAPAGPAMEEGAPEAMPIDSAESGEAPPAVLAEELLKPSGPLAPAQGAAALPADGGATSVSAAPAANDRLQLLEDRERKLLSVCKVKHDQLGKIAKLNVDLMPAVDTHVRWLRQVESLGRQIRSLKASKRDEDEREIELRIRAAEQQLIVARASANEAQRARQQIEQSMKYETSKLQEAEVELRICFAELLHYCDPFGKSGIESHREAIAALDRLLAEEPRFAFAYLARGFAQLNVGDFANARSDFAWMRRLDATTSPLAAAAGAFILHREGNEKTSEMEFGKATSAFSEAGAIWLYRGRACFERGDHPQALRYLERAALLARDTPSVHIELALVLSTSPRESVRDGKRAVEHGLQACRLTRWECWRALDALAAAHAEAGDYLSARQHIDQAAALAPPAVQQELLARMDLYRQDRPYRVKD